MKRVTGIGGIFFNAKDPVALRAMKDANTRAITNPVSIIVNIRAKDITRKNEKDFCQIYSTLTNAEPCNSLVSALT